MATLLLGMRENNNANLPKHRAIKSIYLALSEMVTGSLGPSTSQNAEGSWEHSHTERSDLQYL